jgi:hypothetical protein
MEHKNKVYSLIFVALLLIGLCMVMPDRMLPMKKEQKDMLCLFGLVTVFVVGIISMMCGSADQSCTVCNKDNCQCPKCNGCDEGFDHIDGGMSPFSLVLDNPQPSTEIPLDQTVDDPTFYGSPGLSGSGEELEEADTHTFRDDPIKYEVIRHESNIQSGFHGPLGHTALDRDSWVGVA